MEKWRFLDTGANSGYWNMAVDEAIFTFAREKDFFSPTLRFYQWEPTAISIGYAQKINEGLNLRKCKRLKIGIVRRYTGGGAIFHNDELTYSFISRIDADENFASILASYKQVCNGIIKGLSQLGIQAKFRGGLPSSGRDRKAISSLKEEIPCFMANSKHDLVVDGKKIVGNAQRRTKETFLQQGSLPLAYDFNLINGLFPQSDGFSKRAISISEILGKRISLKEIKEKMLMGFADNFSVDFKENSLSEEELFLARKLFKEKYSLPEWTFKGIKGER